MKQNRSCVIKGDEKFTVPSIFKDKITSNSFNYEKGHIETDTKIKVPGKRIAQLITAH